MCSQVIRTKTSWQQNVKTKPTTHLKSAIYMKKLVAMSISHIIYLRGLMPDHAFEDREFDGVGVKILSEKSGFVPAIQIISWLKGAFEAFDKKYLEKLEFVFFNAGAIPRISEHYTFQFVYNEGNVTVNCENAKKEQSTVEMKLDDVRMSAVNLLHHTTLLLESMSSITQSISMRVRLLYYDEVTPDDYEPPGFKKAEPIEYVFEHPPVKLRHGTVNTGFHTVSLRSKICKSNFKRGSDPTCSIPEEENGPDSTNLTLRDSFAKPSSENRASKDPSEKRESELTDLDMDYVPSSQQPGNKSQEPHSREEAQGSGENTPSDVQHADIYCPCGQNVGTASIVFCIFCRRWNHASCYRFYGPKSVPADFCCVFCHNSKPGASCHDPTLVPLSQEHREIICLYRRALINCMSAWRIDRQTLMSELSIPEDLADRMLLYMDKDKAFFSRKRGRGSYYHINQSTLLNNVMAKYLVQGCVELPDIGEKELSLTSSAKKMSLAEMPIINSDNVSHEKSDIPLAKRLYMKSENSDENVPKTKKRKLHESNESLTMGPGTSCFRI